MKTPHNCVGRKPHLFYRRRPIWRVGLSYYTHDFGRDDDLPRHHSSLELAKAYVTAINETRLYPEEPAACGSGLLCIYDMREPDGISHEAHCPNARKTQYPHTLTSDQFAIISVALDGYAECHRDSEHRAAIDELRKLWAFTGPVVLNARKEGK